jgi:hypothetical protein
MTTELRPDNMRIWDAVCETNPNNTKPVTFGRKFTAIDAYSQIQAATEQWGPVGVGWGWSRDFEVLEDVLICHVGLWHSGDQAYRVTVVGTAPLWTGKDHKRDGDAHKKALTDGITKALSYLGFNADVFLGRFDDDKYVAEMREKFTADGVNLPAPEEPAVFGDSPLPDERPDDQALMHQLRGAVKRFGFSREYAVFLAGGTTSELSKNQQVRALGILMEAGLLRDEIAKLAKNMMIEGSAFDVFVAKATFGKLIDDLDVEGLKIVRDALKGEGREGIET